MTTYTSKFYPFNEYDISYERKGICSICDGEMVNGVRISRQGTTFLFGNSIPTWSSSDDFRICNDCFKKILEHKQ